ncbi:TPA: hypothetical protein EYO57_24460 [Candidatus Poribacteria bacterium]|nr:hypothetical protein [Candidatus Poribacteria bacterium]
MVGIDNAKNDRVELKHQLTSDLFNQLFQENLIENDWDCGECHAKKGMYRQEIWTEIPNILFLGLKRTYYINGGNKEYPIAVSPPPVWEYKFKPGNSPGRFYKDAVKKATHKLFALVF